MDLKGKLRKGLRIVGADNREYGTIDRFDDQYAYVGGRRIPVSAFERMDQDRLYLSGQGTQYFADTSDRLGNQQEIRVPIHEERLRVEKRQGELGSVDIRKTVETERVDIPVELRHEEVSVDEVDVPDRPLTAGEQAQAFNEGTVHVPVREEEAIARKETVVTGEVHVNREVQTERETINDTVRRETVGVDHDRGIPVHHSGADIPHWDAVRDERRQAWERRSTGSGSRWQDVEPGYHYAHEMSADPRFQGRSWREVEPDLRAGYGDWSRSRGYMTDDDSWARVYRELEVSWEETRQTSRGRR